MSTQTQVNKLIEILKRGETILRWHGDSVCAEIGYGSKPPTWSTWLESPHTIENAIDANQGWLCKHGHLLEQLGLNVDDLANAPVDGPCAVLWLPYHSGMEELGYVTLNNDYLAEVCNMILDIDGHITIPTHENFEDWRMTYHAELVKRELIRREIAEA